MRAQSTIRNRRREAGIALLISIFVLLLISVVAIALIVASGTESSLAGNYRSATGVYYASVAGLEEVRGRLRPQDPNSFKNTASGFLPPSGTPLAVCSPVYVINPIGGETVAPWDSASTYPDTEFNQEFAGICALPNPSPSTPSIWNRNPLNALPVPGPFYKWVRINAVSEQSLQLDVAPYDSTPNDAVPIFYDGTTGQLNNSSLGSQVLEITALAVLPNGSQKLVQYLVAPTPIQLPPLPAALTLAGKITGGSSTVAYSSPASNNQFQVLGTNQDCNGNSTGTGNVPAIGVFNSTDINTVIFGGNGGNGIKPASVRNTNYVGYSGSPDVETVYSSFPPAMQTPAGLDAALQSIIQNADAVITPTPSGTPPYLGTATGSALTPLGMSSNNLLTVVVNGNLDISNWSNDGYGLLLVTGTFTYDPDTTCNGIILVIGQGIVNGSHMQYKQINGAMLVARTRDANNQVIAGPDLEGASVIFSNSMQGNGIRYSSCWIQKAQPTSNYRILSFHEIAQ